jgi:hypothetical protein
MMTGNNSIQGNLPRPLEESDAVWLTDLSGRYPEEWSEVKRQVRQQGSPSFNPAPIPRIEIVLKLGFGWSLWKKVQQLCLWPWQGNGGSHGSSNGDGGNGGSGGGADGSSGNGGV